MDSRKKMNIPDNIYIPNLFRMLWRKKLPILAGAVLGAAACLIGSWILITPLYTASVTLYVNNSDSQGSAGYITQSDLYASSKLVDTYAAIILSDAILEDVSRDAAVDMSTVELADILEIESVNDTEVFKVSASHPKPETAAQIVDSIARIAPEQITSIVKGSSVTVINYAKIPSEIAFPNYTLMMIAGFAVGMVAVAGYLLIRAMLDTRIKTASDFSHWNYPLLVSIPDFLDTTHSGYGYYGKREGRSRRNKKRPQQIRQTAAAQDCLLAKSTPFAIQEAYKTLRTNVIFSSPDQEKKVILISSSLPGEAKSTTAINLAAAFAQTQSRVLLIDCDLRLPSIAKRLRLKQSPGLTDLMLGLESDENALSVLKNGLHVLPSGTIPPNPTELLGSKKMELLLARLAARYDCIIMDTPPLETMPDASILARFATDVILVVRQNMTEKAALNSVVGKLEFAKAKILGFVLTCVSEDGYRSYRKYDYYQAYAQGREKSAGKGRRKNRPSSTPEEKSRGDA